MPKPCPVSREKVAAAEATQPKDVRLIIDGVEYKLELRDLNDKTESIGWTYNDRGEVSVDGVKCPAMIQANVTLIGSKIDRPNRRG